MCEAEVENGKKICQKFLLVNGELKDLLGARKLSGISNLICDEILNNHMCRVVGWFNLSSLLGRDRSWNSTESVIFSGRGRQTSERYDNFILNLPLSSSSSSSHRRTYHFTAQIFNFLTFEVALGAYHEHKLLNVIIAAVSKRFEAVRGSAAEGTWARDTERLEWRRAKKAHQSAGITKKIASSSLHKCLVE